jgi:hypothetical protein
MRGTWAALALSAIAAAAQTPAAKVPATQTFTDAELHLTFTYPAALQPMDPRTVTGESENSRFGTQPDADSEGVQSATCRKVLLSLGRVNEGAQGRLWATLTMVDVGPACIPPKALKNHRAMDAILTPLVSSGTQILGMMSLGPESLYMIQGHRMHFAGSQGLPVAKTDLQPSDVSQTIANFAVQVNDHIVSWRIEANDTVLLNRILASQVDFGAGPPAPLFPGQLQSDSHF